MKGRGIIILFLSSVAVVVLFRVISGVSPQPKVIPHSSNSYREPDTLQELLAIPPQELGHVDIALMNLLCAKGLVGAEILNVHNFLARLDGMARYVETETGRHLHRFRESPSEFQSSMAYFNCIFLATILQQDLGIRYNPGRITAPGTFEPNSVFFADSRDIFLHGLLGERRLGTCASLPILYVAVGRRLGYPLKLVPAKNHLFVRWQDSRERLNFEATGIGFATYEDHHYRNWPLPITPEEEKEFGYLVPLTPMQELSAFLALRGHCLLAQGLFNEALDAHAHALRLNPESPLQQLIFAQVHQEITLRTHPEAFLPPEALLQSTSPLAFSGQRPGEGLISHSPRARFGPPDPNPLRSAHALIPQPAPTPPTSLIPRHSP